MAKSVYIIVAHIWARRLGLWLNISAYSMYSKYHMHCQCSNNIRNKENKNNDIK